MIDIEKIVKGKTEREIAFIILEFQLKRLMYEDSSWNEWFELCGKSPATDEKESFRDVLEKAYQDK